MKKKIVWIVVILVLLWGILFGVDYARCMDLKKPLFTVASAICDDGGSGTYWGPGYRVELEGCLDPEYGYRVEAVEFWLFGVVLVGAAIT